MPKTKSPLPTPSQADLKSNPDRILKGPKGGLMWKCAYCGRPASSETRKGNYVCYAHGGVPKKTRDPLERAKAKAKGKTLRPPGRPIKHGFYSRGKRVDVRELVEAYQEAKLDLNHTDLDILHLRARIDNLIADEPQVEAVRTALDTFLNHLHDYLDQHLEDEGCTVSEVLDRLNELRAIQTFMDKAARFYRKLESYDERIKRDHERIIKLVDKRADTKLKLSASEQLEMFEKMVTGMMVVLREMLQPEQIRALQMRFKRDLMEVNPEMFEGRTVDA